MPVDYAAEMNVVLEESIPEWFYGLSVNDRNTIYNSALTEYESVTSAKNTSFLTYWANLIAPYMP